MHGKQYSEIWKETNVRQYRYLCTEQFYYQNEKRPAVTLSFQTIYVDSL
jgi:hypothetical protein